MKLYACRGSTIRSSDLTDSVARLWASAARMLGLAAFVGLLGGCASLTALNDPESREQKLSVDRHSAYPAIRRVYFEQVNIIELIDPEGRTRTASPAFESAWDDLETAEARIRYGRRYDLVLGWFRSTGMLSDEEKKRVRNSVQERIMSVSESRCNVFKTHLRRDQSDKNFVLGSLTTASGVLGALLSGATASRNLAGAAGLFSGLQAEYNQAYFSNLTAQVIVRGIEAKHAKTYQRIRQVGQPLSIVEYPMEAAIKDAIYFDGLCSTIVGLDEAAESIQLAQNPGLEAATRTLLRSRLLQRVANEDLNKLATDEVLGKLGMPVADILSVPVAVPGAGIDAQLTAGANQLFRAVESTRQSLEGSAQVYANDLGEHYVAVEKPLIEKAAQPAAGAPAHTATPKATVVAGVRKALVDNLVTIVGFPDCVKAAADTTTQVVAAENSLKAATTEQDKLAKRQVLVEAQLKAEAQRRKILLFGDLVAMDLKAAAATLGATIDAAKAADATLAKLKTDFAKLPIVKHSADARCNKLMAAS